MAHFGTIMLLQVSHARRHGGQIGEHASAILLLLLHHIAVSAGCRCLVLSSVRALLITRITLVGHLSGRFRTRVGSTHIHLDVVACAIQSPLHLLQTTIVILWTQWLHSSLRSAHLVALSLNLTLLDLLELL